MTTLIFAITAITAAATLPELTRLTRWLGRKAKLAIRRHRAPRPAYHGGRGAAVFTREGYATSQQPFNRPADGLSFPGAAPTPQESVSGASFSSRPNSTLQGVQTREGQ